MITPQDEQDIDQLLDEANVQQKDTEVSIPEAPAVANIKVWIKGYGVMFTVRGEKMNDILTKTTTLIDYAESHGWKNTWNTTGQPTQGQPVQQPSSIICGIHGTPMKQIPAGVSKKTGRSYPAFIVCESMNADGSRCSWKPEEK